MRTLIVLTTLSFLLVSCPRPKCSEIASFRCNGEMVEICDSSGRWSFLADCEQVSEQSEGIWTCVMGICEQVGD
ncbi:MAG: hypothetical protein LAT68_17365 [Cyclobacteriaceae bacterium]|nr:hypothetical protein [Cyclobacteriaceae bacterium]